MSLDKIVGVFKSVIVGYPITSVLTLVGVICGLILVGSSSNLMASRMLFTALLFFSVSIGLKQIEKQGFSKNFKIWSYLLSAILLVLFFVYRSGMDGYILRDILQFIMWFGLGVLFLSISPFLLKNLGSAQDYWEYCRRIGNAIAAAFAYSAIVFLGLSVALKAINELFSLYLQGEVWVQLWILVVGLMSVPIFLTKFPNVDAKADIENFPKEIRLLGGWVFLSLVSIYFLILYTYTVQILITNEWPKGIISALIVGFSTLGLATFVMLYPLSMREDRYKKIFTVMFISFIPQVAVLFYALSFRLKDYGITENRYLLFGFGLWLVLISLYFIFSKVKNLKVVVYSLAIVLVLVSVGPLSASNVAKNSQLSRLRNLLASGDLLENNKLKKGSVGESNSSGEIYSLFRYFNSYHGVSSLKNLFPKEVKLTSLQDVVDYAGPDYGSGYGDLDSRYFFTNRDEQGSINIAGYDYLVEQYGILKIGDDTYTFELDQDKYVYEIRKNNLTVGKIDLNPLLEKLKQNTTSGQSMGFSSEEMSVVFSEGNLDVKIHFDSINLQGRRLEVTGWKLVKIK